jgi:uncharacterized protein (TIGR02145 family)
MKHLNPFESLFSRSSIKKSEFTDPRDGKTYRTVIMGDVEWFLDNLDYDDTDDFGGNSALEIFFTKEELPSIKENDINRNGCGRFYRFNSLENACPEGWEIPRRDKFIELFKNITQRNPHEWQDRDREIIFKSLCGNGSILELGMCGSYEKPRFMGTSSFAGDRPNSNGFNFMGNKTGYYWSSTPGAMNNGGAVFIFGIFGGDQKRYLEDVGYGYYAVRPVRKNI